MVPPQYVYNQRHLNKPFRKLGITSRKQIAAVQRDMGLDPRA